MIPTNTSNSTSPTLEQTPLTTEQRQSWSLPSPPVSKVEPHSWLVRPPPFPPPTSSTATSSSMDNVGQEPDKDHIVLDDLEHFVSYSNSAVVTGGTSASFTNTITTTTIPIDIPDLAAPQIQSSPLLFLASDNDMPDDFTFDTNDFVLLPQDPTSPPMSPILLFPPL